MKQKKTDPKNYVIVPKTGWVIHLYYDNITMKKIKSCLSRFSFQEIERKLFEGTYSNLTMIAHRFHCTPEEYIAANKVENNRAIHFTEKEDALIKIFPDFEQRIKMFKNWFDDFCELSTRKYEQKYKPLEINMRDN
ncbi:MAG: hypothetical protein PHP92_05585 [Candidatus Nanoarchaeia archaeon]|nr:hypothetical protein [Candidatus Nanoarchaeia archaeon]